MRDFLSDFFFGKVIPCEVKMPASPERLTATRELTEAEASVRSCLDDEGIKALERLLAAQQNVESLSEQDHFTQGFKTGARFMMAILSDTSDGVGPESRKTVV